MSPRPLTALTDYSPARPPRTQARPASVSGTR